MMRRLLETSIIEAYEKKGIAENIKGKDGNYFQLTKLIDSALNEAKMPLSRNAKQMLPVGEGIEATLLACQGIKPRRSPAFASGPANHVYEMAPAKCSGGSLLSKTTI
jgi:hypothetical protein